MFLRKEELSIFHEHEEAYFGQERKVIDNPSESLSEQELRQLAEELSSLTASGFLREGVTSELIEDVYQHIAGCDRLSILRDRETGVPAAFMAVSLRDLAGLKLYHLEGIIVDSKMRGNGFAPAILKRDLEDVGADLIAFHTQSRSMQGLGLKVARLDDDLALRAAGLIGTHNQQGLVDAGRYGGECLYGDIEAFAGDAIAEIDYLGGDARIFAGYVKRRDL